MRESANFCENRLNCYRGAVNAALGTSGGFVPVFPQGSMKTVPENTVMPLAKVKTDLPPFVSSYRDRHGKTRYRFRRKGVDRPIRGELGSPRFEAEYGEVMAGNAPRTAKPDPKNCVYFISDGHAIKIGFASSPKERMRAHQTSCPRRLRLMAVEKGGIGLERLYHERFAAHRIRGEWFHIHDDILAEVARLRKVRP
jgi:hypothetical protein